MNDCWFLTIAQSSDSLAYHKPLTMHELKNCSDGRRGDRRNLRRENDQYTHRGEWLFSARNNRHGHCWLNFRCLANAMSLTS